MRISILKTLIKKEIIDVIRDKKTVFAMIVMPILLYPILMIGMSFFMQMTIEESKEKTIDILVQGDVTEGFLDFASEHLEKAHFVEESQEPFYTLSFEDNQVIIQYDSSKDAVEVSLSELKGVFQAFEIQQLEQAVDSAGMKVNTIGEDDIILDDQATDTMLMAKLMGQVLPLLLIVGVILGVIYPAIDIVTGEKERHTLETLRSLPITALEIVVSKFATIVICGLVSAMLNLISIICSVGYFIASLSAVGEFGFEGISLSEMVVPLLIALLCLVIFAFFASAATMIVVSFASTFKEAQNYITPLMLGLMMPAYITMMPTITLNSITSLIPVVNISLLIREAFAFKLDWSLVALVIISNIAYSLFAMLLLGNIFNRETVLFGSGKSFRLLESRKEIVKGGLPGISDAFAIFAIAIVILLYGGLVILELTDVVELQLVSTQAIIVSVTFLYGIYIKSNFKELFHFKKCSLKYFFIGIPLIGVGLLITLLLQNVLLTLVPGLESLLVQFQETLQFDQIAIYILVVAVCPAICEELLFRGFILTGLQVEKHPVFAIVTSSSMFGIFHMNVFQLITGMVLGGVLGFVTYKSKSIYPAMALHFLNNLVAVFISG